jgi:hypothetical protein
MSHPIPQEVEEKLKPFEWLKDFPSTPNPDCSTSVYDDVRKALATDREAVAMAERERIAALCYQLENDSEKMYQLIFQDFTPDIIDCDSEG